MLLLATPKRLTIRYLLEQADERWRTQICNRQPQRLLGQSNNSVTFSSFASTPDAGERSETHSVRI
jgi:hypothetical protein